MGKDILVDTLSMALAKRAPFSGFFACQVYIDIPQLEFYSVKLFLGAEVDIEVRTRNQMPVSLSKMDSVLSTSPPGAHSRLGSRTAGTG